jgi:hypothetical protein
MEMKCVECGATLNVNYAKGMGVCSDAWCAIEYPVMVNDADTNASAVHGENAQNAAGDDEGKAGTKMNPYADTKDWSGKRLDAKTRRKFRTLGWADRNSQRVKDPMFGQLVAMIREMFGKDVANATRLLAKAAAQKLTPEQEARRKTLSTSDQKRLACPKTSICRKKKGVKGDGDKQNLQIMALAIADLSAQWLSTAPINVVALRNQYGITKEQFVNAKKTISNHYKARVSMGWAMAPRSIRLVAKRADALDNASTNLVDAVSSRLDDDDLDNVMEIFWNALSDLKEPTVDGPVANVPMDMVAASVFYAALRQLGLHRGLLNCVAGAVDLSGAGVKSRLENFQAMHEAGALPEAAALFTDIENDSEHGPDEDASAEN